MSTFNTGNPFGSPPFGGPVYRRPFGNRRNPFVYVLIFIVISILGVGGRLVGSGFGWQMLTGSDMTYPHGLYMVSADEGWAVGAKMKFSLFQQSSSSLIMHYKAGHWSVVDTPTAASLQSVAMVSADEGWAVGSGGIIMHYKDGKWVGQEVPSSWYLSSVSMDGPDDGWAVGYDATTASAAPVSVPFDSFSGSATNADPGTDTGDDSGGAASALLVHYQGGQWSEVLTATYASLVGVAMVSKDEGWAISDEGDIYHYTKGNWLKQETIPSHSLSAIQMLSASDGWIVGDGGLILRYVGGKWSPQVSPSKATLTDIHMSSPDEGWAITDDTTNKGGIVMYHYTAGKWNRVVVNVQANPTSVFMVAPDDGWAACPDGTFLHYTGGDWHELKN